MSDRTALRRDGLRRRWVTAFAVFLTILMTAGVTTWVFSRQAVGEFGTAAHRQEAASNATAALRRDVSSQEHQAHAILTGAPVDAGAFLAQQQRIDRQFASGRAVLRGAAERAELDVAYARWRHSLEAAHLWGRDATTARSRTTAARAGAVHAALAEDTSAVLDSLASIDTLVRAAVNEDLENARRSAHDVLWVVAALFLLAVGAALWSGRRMSNDLLRPISALRDGAARLGDDLGTRVELPDRARATELGELADAFNAMADAIQRVQNQRVTLLRRTLDVAEHERSRVANELHDGPIQRLAAMTYLVDAGLVRDQRDPGAGRACLTDLRDRLAHEVQGLRRMMAELRPPMLDQVGLAAGLEDYVVQFSDTHRLPVTLTGGTGSARLEPAVETVAYRFVQEALTNVARHAKATRATVRLSRCDDTIAVAVCDDGVGFEPADARVDVHLGLATMSERVTSLGGTFGIHATPGGGTMVEARIPTAIAAPGWTAEDQDTEPYGPPSPRPAPGQGQFVTVR